MNRSGDRVVVWMSAMTNAAIGMFKQKFNFLCSLISGIPELRQKWLRDLTIVDLRESDKAKQSSTHLQLVLGTVYKLWKSNKDGHISRPDVLLIDEAGQVSVGAAALIIGKLYENGRLIGTKLSGLN